MSFAVLQIIPSLGAGGAEQACVDITAGLRAAGHPAFVVSSGGPRVMEITQAGGDHFTRPAQSKNPLVIMANALWLARFIREHKINIIHARSRAPAWSAWLASRLAPCKFITTFHAAYKFSGPVKKFYNRVMAKADRIIAISDFIAAHIRKNYGVDPAIIRTIPRGINLDKFTADHVTGERRAKLSRAWGIKEGQRLILLPSRLSPIKGQAVLIKAMALLAETEDDLVAVIVGDDQGRVGYRRELEQLINQYGLKDRVQLVAHCHDMPAAYSLSTLVVAPSLVPEGFGRVPIEAMAMGVPVIASALGGYTETIIPGETGWLTPAGDARALAEAISEALHRTPPECAAMAIKARQEVATHYDKRKMVADTLVVYTELVKST